MEMSAVQFSRENLFHNHGEIVSLSVTNNSWETKFDSKLSIYGDYLFGTGLIIVGNNSMHVQTTFNFSLTANLIGHLFTGTLTFIQG